MTPKQRQEEISKAYVHAVAAACGYKVGTWSQDDGCLDTSIAAAIKRRPHIDIQLKATTQNVLSSDGTFLSWTLERSHYETLISDGDVDMYLVVLLLPHEDEVMEDVEVTVKELTIRKAAYYLRMTGLKPMPENQDSKSVRLHTSNLFAPAALRAIMKSLSTR